MKKPKRYTVFTEQNIYNLQDVLVKQRFLRYFSSDDRGMAESIAASLQRINHSWRIVEGEKVQSEWIREGFCASS